MVFDLMFSLNATEDQLDFPVVYGSAKNGWMGEDYKTPTDNITYLLDKIIEVIPAPKQIEGTPQMLITSLDYSSYQGRIAVGRVHRGTLKDGMQVTIAHRDGSMEKTKIKELHTFEGVFHHQNEFARGKSHVNGIESFWSFAKRRLAKFNGLTDEKFILHLKETECRFNLRGEDFASFMLKLFF